MTAQGLNPVKLRDDARPQLERTFAQGRPCKFDVSSILPLSIAQLDVSRLSSEYGDAPAQPLNSQWQGTRARVSDICAPIVDSTQASGDAGTSSRSLTMGNAMLSEVCPQLADEVINMPMFSSWQEMATVLWIGGSLSPVLHFDGWDNLLIQLAGRKQLIVYDPAHTRQLSKGSGVRATSQLDGRATGVSAKGVRYYESWLEPGESLAIPCGALHSLKGSPDSLSLNCFLYRGPRPRFARYHYRYLTLFSWPGRISAMVPAGMRAWLANRWGVTTLATWSGIRTTFPWTFARRQASSLRKSRG